MKKNSTALHVVTLFQFSCPVKSGKVVTHICKVNVRRCQTYCTAPNLPLQVEWSGEGGQGATEGGNPTSRSPWLRFSGSEHPGCRMLFIRYACVNPLALSRLCGHLLWECFYWKDNRPCRANGLIPDPSLQTVQDTSCLCHCPWKPDFTSNMTLNFTSTCNCFVSYFHIPNIAADCSQQKMIMTFQINQTIDPTVQSRFNTQVFFY